MKTKEESVRGFCWQVANTPTGRGRADGSIPAVTSALLKQEGIAPTEQKQFLNPPTYSAFMQNIFPTIKSMRQFDEAAETIANAIKDGKKIGISSDYDADGNCSAALMYRFLRECGVPHDRIVVHVPNRAAEGYGVNESAVNTMHDQGVNIVITLDNGTHATKPIQKALENGMQVVVVDHHPDSEEQEHRIPDGEGEALVVNPTYTKTKKQGLRGDEDGKLAASMHDMAAVGVTYMLACGIAEKLGADIRSLNPTSSIEGSWFEQHQIKPPCMQHYLGIAAIATVADVVNIKKPINRFIIKEGLDVINQGIDPTLTHFARLMCRHWPIDEEDIAFTLGPIINAPGRLADSVAWQFMSGATRSSNPEDSQYYERSLGLPEDVLQQARINMVKHIDTLRRQIFIQKGGDAKDYISLNNAPEEYIADLDNTAKDTDSVNLGELDPYTRHLMLLSQADNKQRQILEALLQKDARQQALEILQRNPDTQVLVLQGEDWHEGLVGIVAGRTKEEFGLPTLVGSVKKKDGQWQFKCSGRSIDVPDYPADIGEAFRQLSQKASHSDESVKIFDSAGGHPMAAGASFMRPTREALEHDIEALRTALNESGVIPQRDGSKQSLGEQTRIAREHATIPVAGLMDLNQLKLSPDDLKNSTLHGAFKKWDFDIPTQKPLQEKYLEDLKKDNPSLYQRLAFIASIQDTEQMKPFGQGHRKPLFMLRNQRIHIRKIMGPGETQRHFALTLTPQTLGMQQGGAPLDAFAFHSVDTKLGDALNLAANIQGKNPVILCSANLEITQKPDEFGLTVRPTLMVEDMLYPTRQNPMWRENEKLYGVFAGRHVSREITR